MQSLDDAIGADVQPWTPHLPGDAQLPAGQRRVPGIEAVRAGVEVGAQRHVDLRGLGLGERGEGVLELEEVLEVRSALLLAAMDLLQQAATTELSDGRGRQRPRIRIADATGDAGDLRRLPG